MKDHKEMIKTVIITILITANVSFMAGIWYNQNQTDNLNREIQTQVDRLKAELSDPAKAE